MRANLYQTDLEFIEECKEVFESDHRRVTNFSEDKTLIALRYGADNDCIRLFELGEEKAFFHNIMEKCPVETVKKEAIKDIEDFKNSSFMPIPYRNEIEDKICVFMARYGLKPSILILGKKQAESFGYYGFPEDVKLKYSDMDIVVTGEESRVTVALSI